MRTLVALALVLAVCGPVACGRSDRRDSPAATDAAPSASTPRGPDAIVLRVAKGGGLPRAYRYPRLDSAIWTATERTPGIDHVLAFDAEAGSLAYVDTRGMPGRIDLRVGTVRAAARAKLASLASTDGWAIFGVAGDGSVSRLTPSGNWSYKAPAPARELFPQRDGSLLILADRKDGTTLWRVRPPEEALTDTALLPRAQRSVRTQVGDRVYFTVDSGLIGVSGRDLAPVPSIRFRRPVRSIVPTPSGDRLFLISDSASTLVVVDRYEEEADEVAELPGQPADLRMDPLGRYLLVRPSSGDSAWVVAVATGRVMGSVRTTWRTDLPVVAPDGAIALASGDDVQIVDGETLEPRRRVRGGAREYWHFFTWNGFRPRARELDQPVVFDSVQDSLTTDSLFAGQVPEQAAPTASGAPIAAPAPTFAAPAPSSPPSAPAATAPAPPPAATQPPRDTAVRRGIYYASFAALLSEERARAQAAEIRVGGATAHVVPTTREGATIYRVVVGPFPTRAEAERAGQAAGRNFWVYSGVP